MAHKSFSSLNAKRVRAEAALLSKANKHYARAAQLEKQGKPLQARTEATKGRQLAQRAHKAGAYTDGPVGRLPNPTRDYGLFRNGKLYSVYPDRQWANDSKRAHIQADKKFSPKHKQVWTVRPLPKVNPKRADLSWEEAERLGILKRAGVKKPEIQIQPRMFSVTWHSSLKNKRVGFIRPIAADTKSEAITIAKSMIDNDPKAKAFVAREIKRNGIVDIAAGMQALDYLGRTVKGRRNPDNVKFVIEYKNEHGNWGAMKRSYPTMELALKAAARLERRHPRWIVQVATTTEIKRNPGDIHIDAGHVTIVGKTKRIRTQNPRKDKSTLLREHQQGKHDQFFEPYCPQCEENVRFLNRFFPIKRKRKHKPGTTLREARKELERKLGKRRNSKKKNPSVTTLSKTFQGKANGAVDEYYASDAAPKNLARAGKLVFLKVAGRSLRLPGAMVAIAPNNKLWITGKQALFATKAKSGEGLDMGEVSQICYETAKAHIENGETVEYVHEFGEDGGRRPHLIIDHEGMPILRGGDYTIKAEGIVN